MTEQNAGSDWKSSTRGEAAWKEAREGVAARNDEVRRSGRREREAFERERAEARRADEARRHAALLGRQAMS